MPGWFGLPEMILVVFVVLIVFGAGKLPKVAQQLGTGIRNFQDSLKGENEDDEPKQLEDKKDKTKA